MGFWDKAKGFMDSASESAERVLKSKAGSMSDSELQDLYSRTENANTRAIVEAELRKRGLL